MKQPNILIFMTDHQRADTVLPEHPAIMPNVARLGAEGVTFTGAHCPMAHCCPARATFFSGLFPSRHGVWNNVSNQMALSRGLNPGVRLFSEDLRDAGYELAMSGKWHVSSEQRPSDFGWEELRTISAVDRYPDDMISKQIAKRLETPETGERDEGVILRRGYPKDDLLYGEGPLNRHDVSSTEDALEAMPRLAASGKPWAMFVGAIQPHAPYVTSAKYRDMYNLDDIDLPASYEDKMGDKPGYYRKLRQKHFDQLTPDESRDAIRHFWAQCTHLDDLFGSLLDALDATGQADNTIVLYTADHGDYLGEHGLFHKGVPAFRGAYEVPAVMRWPEGIANPGRRVDALVSLADFAPTFTEAAGKTPDPSLTGRSLMPFLRGEEPHDWRQEVCTQCDGVEHYFTQRTIRTAEWKYVYNGFDFDELYNLKDDPDEMTNLAGDPAYDEVVYDLVRRMWRFAVREDDHLAESGNYITVGLAPWGPVEGHRE